VRRRWPLPEIWLAHCAHARNPRFHLFDANAEAVNNARAHRAPRGASRRQRGRINGEEGPLTLSGGGRSRRDLMLMDRDMDHRQGSLGCGGDGGEGRRRGVDRSRRVVRWIPPSDTATMGRHGVASAFGWTGADRARANPKAARSLVVCPSDLLSIYQQVPLGYPHRMAMGTHPTIWWVFLPLRRIW
jgi:hypothetical protein